MPPRVPMTELRQGAHHVQRDTSAAATLVGVSIPIPEPYAARLTRARAEVGDPLAHAVPPHITLLPPTEVADEDLARVEEHLAEVAARHGPFIIELAGTGSFRPVSPVVFVGLRTGVKECSRLQRAVNDDVLAQDLRFPYHPHVTIAHELDESTLDRAARSMGTFDAVFPVVHFSLYFRGADGVWRDTADFALTS